jgi:hypothetical protein
MTRPPYAVILGVSTALILILNGGGVARWGPGPANNGHFGGGGFRQGPPSPAPHFPMNFHGGAFQGGGPAPATHSAPGQFGGGHFGGGRQFAPAPITHYARSSYSPAYRAAGPAPMVVHFAPGHFGVPHFGDGGGRQFAPAPMMHYAGSSYSPVYRAAGPAPMVMQSAPRHFGGRHFGAPHFGDGRGERRFAPAPAPIYAGHMYRQAYRDAGPAPAVWHRARQPVSVAQVYYDASEGQVVPAQGYRPQADGAPGPYDDEAIYAARVRPSMRAYEDDDFYAAPRAVYARQSAYYEAPLVESYQAPGVYIQRDPTVTRYSRPRAVYYNEPRVDCAPRQSYGQQGARVYYVSEPQAAFHQRAGGERHRAYVYWGPAGG